MYYKMKEFNEVPTPGLQIPTSRSAAGCWPPEKKRNQGSTQKLGSSCPKRGVNSEVCQCIG